MPAIFDNPEFWVLIAFLIFAGMLVSMKVPATVGKALDDRAAGIRKDLDDAARLRKEAEQLLADYQRKAREAEAEAKSIIEAAKREAENLAAETKKALAESIERRTKLAEDKIARAEAQAVSEVRATAVDVAVSAAETLLKAKLAGATATGLVEQSIRDLKGKLN
jgi:F-type H+-transporting ATPase subunit b